MKPDDNSVSTLVPRCDGGPPPAEGDASAHASIKREFVAAYHRLNMLSRQLASVRQAPPSPERRAAERLVLQEIEAALLARDALVDRHAAMGIVADAVFERGVATDLRFTTPGRRTATRPVSSLCFAVTAPAPLRPA